jgi:hypothetical protein
MKTFNNNYIPLYTEHRGKRLRMRGAQKDGEEFKCQIVNKNMAI